MKCLVCNLEFDHSPAVASADDLAHATSPAEIEALHVHARRKRAAEQSAWKFVRVLLEGEPVTEGHVCPVHAKPECLSLVKESVK